MKIWMTTVAHPVAGISHKRIADTLTRENWLEKAVVRRGPDSIYYTYIVYGATPETGPWKVEVHGNDVNWEYYPRSHEFSQEFANLDDALRYANGEDDSYFGQSTIPAKRSYWPLERPPESYTIIECTPRRPSKKRQRSKSPNQ